jgi:hypothetical protein
MRCLGCRKPGYTDKDRAAIKRFDERQAAEKEAAEKEAADAKS